MDGCSTGYTSFPNIVLSGSTPPESYVIAPLVHASDTGVILVTINYRLNVFGFLGGDAVKSRTVDGSSGNFGIQDQQMAMQWVHDNIASFGGDASRVTIFGESAGGQSIIQHLVRPSSYPYYSRAIVQSGKSHK